MPTAVFNQADESICNLPKGIAYGASALTLLVATLGLLGLILDSPFLARLNPSGAPMVLPTILLLYLSTWSTFAIARDHLSAIQLWLVRLFGFVIAVYSGLVLVQYMTNADLHIDIGRALSADGPYAHPSRTAPETALSLLLLGLSIVTASVSRSKFRITAMALAALAWAVPVVSLTSHFFGADQVYSLVNLTLPTTGIAYNTALCLIVLSLALVVLTATGNLSRLLIKKSMGGMMARRMLVTVIVVPPILAGLSSALDRIGWLDEHVSFALTSLGSLFVIGAMGWVTALILDRMEEERNRASRRLVEAREQLIAVVSHDLRNPLGAITGYADLLLDRMRNDPEARVLLGHLKGAAGKIQSLSADILDSARIEEDQLQFQMKATSVREMMDSVSQIFSVVSARKGITYEQAVNVKSDIIRCDRDRIFQVLSNLIGNALKFASAGGKVTVRVDMSGRDRARFSVIDNGPGIDPKSLPHIFERYWKPDGAPKTGVGLGLFIAKTIIDGHGSEIKVSSIPNVETRFEFELPLEMPQAAYEPTARTYNVPAVQAP